MRARLAAVRVLRQARQQLSGFLLRMAIIITGVTLQGGPRLSAARAAAVGHPVPG